MTGSNKKIYTDEQIEKYADALIWGLHTARKDFKKYDTVLVRCDLEAQILGEAVHRKLIKKGYNVIFRFLTPPQISRDFYEFSDSEQRKALPPGETEMYQALNGYVYISAPSSLTYLKGIDTARQNEVSKAFKVIFDIRNKRENKGLFGWTLCTYPTEELARQAGLTLEEYAEQIAKACYLNETDPAAKWSTLLKESTEIKKWLSSLKIDTIQTESASMDLKIKLGDRRKFKGVSGHNIPSFEIFTSPDWRGTEGIYFANLPAFRGGNIIKDIRLEFKEGSAVGISASQGEDYVRKIMHTDEGSCRVGEYSLTDRRFSKIDKFMADTLFDENHGGKYGNSHIAVGASYADTLDGDPSEMTPEMSKTLGFNDSAVHWDMINTEDKKVTATLKGGDKVTIYEHGEFKH